MHADDRPKPPEVEAAIKLARGAAVEAMKALIDLSQGDAPRNAMTQLLAIKAVLAYACDGQVVKDQAEPEEPEVDPQQLGDMLRRLKAVK